MREHGLVPATVERLADTIFRGADHPSIEYVNLGHSIHVYRIHHRDESFYLRVLPTPGETFAPEVRIHSMLRAEGVRVPEVVHFEDANTVIGRSVMVTREIAGSPIDLSGSERSTRQSLAEAGRDLAVINGIVIDGFGWIRRDALGQRLAGRQPTYRSLMLEDLDEHLAILGQRVLSEREIAMVREFIARHDAALDAETGRLAHGDFDARHIFQQDGRYTGVIDFSAIRGASRYYDLGHFRLYDGGAHPTQRLSWLLDGYRQVTRLSDGHDEIITLHSLLIGIRSLGSSLRRWPDQDATHHPMAAAIRRDLISCGR